MALDNHLLNERKYYAYALGQLKDPGDY